MTDKELIELAAKAARIWKDTDPWNGLLKPTGQYWNPLTDDGDAMRLAVKLGLLVNTSGRLITATTPRGGVFYDGNDDPCAATRLAITRAAAEIGRSME